MREAGYYWVKYGNDWVIAEYIKAGMSSYEIDDFGHEWLLEGRPIPDTKFGIINETRILNPDER